MMLIKRNGIYLFAFAFLAMSSAFSHEAYSGIPRVGRYEYIKKDSSAENLMVFKKYEEAKTSKIIYMCIHGAGRYSVRAQWDLTAISRWSAEKIAEKDCGEALAGFMLLAYTSKTEYKY